MKLYDYLNKNLITKKEFAKKVGCAYNYLCEIVREEKTPSIKLIKAISKYTGGVVSVNDLLDQKNVGNQKKQKKVRCNSNVSANSQNLITPHCKKQIVPNLSHSKPLEISLSINGKVLFTKQLHGYYQDGKQGYDYCDEYLKVKCRITPENKKKINEILEHGIPLVDAHNDTPD